MVTKLGISVWSLGKSRVVTFTEYDEHNDASYRITYPINYCEGSDLASWARNRVVKHGCKFYLSADGWDVYVPIPSVISTCVDWYPLHNNDRSNPKMEAEYEKLRLGYHSVFTRTTD